MSSYDDFIAAKLGTSPRTGITGDFQLPESMFPHQEALTRWALRRGRAAIFSDTGTGKMRMELAWADVVRKHTQRPIMIHTPLAVAAQLAAEAARIGIEAKVCREARDLTDGINITNYERMHKFDTSVFGGVVLDESGCIKHQDTRTFKVLTEAYRDTPFKLPATATPAPNDWTELGTHAEFLGICTRAEMLSEFFTHDGGDTSVWRLKGHARDVFWRWVATWGAMVRRPSDLGFDDAAYILPPLHVHEHLVDHEMPLNGMLFAMEAQTLSERCDARRVSVDSRLDACVYEVFDEWGRQDKQSEPWVIWCELNTEQDKLEAAFGDLAFSVRGADSIDEKEDRINRFLARERPIMISKPSIMGHGLNMQFCARMAFVGVTDSWEAYYQAVRRCWRFGQQREVHAHLFASKAEGAVLANLKRKERDGAAMAESLSAETRDAVMAEVVGAVRETNIFNSSQRVHVPAFLGLS